MAQYRLPQATAVLTRKLERLHETHAPYTINQRREGSPWYLVGGCTACPFASCKGCGYEPHGRAD